MLNEDMWRSRFARAIVDGNKAEIASCMDQYISVHGESKYVRSLLTLMERCIRAGAEAQKEVVRS